MWRELGSRCGHVLQGRSSQAHCRVRKGASRTCFPCASVSLPPQPQPPAPRADTARPRSAAFHETYIARSRTTVCTSYVVQRRTNKWGLLHGSSTLCMTQCSSTRLCAMLVALVSQLRGHRTTMRQRHCPKMEWVRFDPSRPNVSPWQTFTRGFKAMRPPEQPRSAAKGGGQGDPMHEARLAAFANMHVFARACGICARRWLVGRKAHLVYANFSHWQTGHHRRSC